MDVRSINVPNFNDKDDMKESDIYVYAAFLKPGYHQLLIYDPLLEKAFCKDFMLNINTRQDIFPEYPVIRGMKQKRRIKNVFENWLEDTYE